MWVILQLRVFTVNTLVTGTQVPKLAVLNESLTQRFLFVISLTQRKELMVSCFPAHLHFVSHTYIH